MMPKGSAGSRSLEENLHAAICVLALILQRPQDLHELLAREQGSNDENDENLPIRTTSVTAESCDAAEVGKEGYFDTDFEDPEEEYEIIDVDEGLDNKSNLAVLRDKVLDRLAESLARFKSDPRGNRGPHLDSKHVSSTMMIEYSQPIKVKFLCAKNEGLDQGGTAEDSKFLDSWSRCMECISNRGKAMKRTAFAYLDLI
jgi:hypothetical protein